jgi:hypothetical protein
MALAAALVLALMGQAPEPSAPPTDDSFAFGLALLADGDSYRAITELKRFGFRHGGLEALRTQLLIGKLYADAQQVEASRFHLQRVIDAGAEPFATTARLLTLRNVCVTRKALASCREEILGLPPTAPLGLDAYARRYFEVLTGAPATFVQVEPALAPQLRALEALSAERAALPRQRPWLAGALSAVLPGSGQLSNGRPLDAALALVLTGVTAYGAVRLLARPQPEWGLGIPVGLLALIFYTGNIVNAVGDAWRLDEQRAEAFARRLEQQAFPTVALAVGPNAATLTVAVRFGDGPALRVLSDASAAPAP